MAVIFAGDNQAFEMHGARFTALVSPKRGSTRQSVWRVELAPGAPATLHQLTDEEVFVIQSGKARVSIGGSVTEAGAGDSIVVPKDTDFSIQTVGDVPLVALVCFPVGGRARLADGSEFTPPWAE